MKHELLTDSFCYFRICQFVNWRNRDDWSHDTKHSLHTTVLWREPQIFQQMGKFNCLREEGQR